MQEDINIEIQIDEIIEKVRTVEFLHGVPVSLPSESVELLRSGIRKAIHQALAEGRERVVGEIDGIKRVDAELGDGENIISRDNYFFNLALDDVLALLGAKLTKKD